MDPEKRQLKSSRSTSHQNDMVKEDGSYSGNKKRKCTKREMIDVTNEQRSRMDMDMDMKVSVNEWWCN